MGRMSARFVGRELGMKTDDVYRSWEKLGVVNSDKHGFFHLTDFGKSVGGKLCRHGTPTFDLEQISKMMHGFGK